MPMSSSAICNPDFPLLSLSFPLTMYTPQVDPMEAALLSRLSDGEEPRMQSYERHPVYLACRGRKDEEGERNDDKWEAEARGTRASKRAS
jgi:hypothetical protein